MTFGRSRSYESAEEEQVIESAYLKYVKIHDYQLVLKMSLGS